MSQVLNSLSIESVKSMNNQQLVAFKHTEDGLLIEAANTVAVPKACFKIKLKRRRRVLFIGDSITDGGWGRSGGSMAPSDKRNQKDPNHLYGHGYMEMCAAHFQSNFPEQDYVFFNRGISGNTLLDMQNRWQQDALSLKPDVVSILIGTNDVDAFLRDTTTSIFDYQQWEQRYRQLISALRIQNPNVKIVLGAPFVAKVGRIGKADNYTLRKSIINRLASIVKLIAQKENAIYIPYNEMFEKLYNGEVRSDYWIWDGIHPTTAGHRRMADLWIESVSVEIFSK